jgi:hypothetical protein
MITRFKQVKTPYFGPVIIGPPVSVDTEAALLWIDPPVTMHRSTCNAATMWLFHEGWIDLCSGDFQEDQAVLQLISEIE